MDKICSFHKNFREFDNFKYIPEVVAAESLLRRVRSK